MDLEWNDHAGEHHDPHESMEGGEDHASAGSNVNDAERDHSFEHAESVNRIALEWYRRCGYQVLEVPMVSVDERCMFVLQALADSDA